MSSTNRGGQRHVSDYYVTPVPQIVAFLHTSREDGALVLPDNLTVLDPCAGGDAKNQMSYSAAFKLVYPNITVTTSDIRDDSPAGLHHDYLDSRVAFPKAELVITNPPFAIADKVIERALRDSNRWVVMLLRLNFLGGQKRQGFWERYPPSHIYVHPRRMSFVPGSSATDSVEYMHCIWTKGSDTPTQLRFVRGAQ